MLGDWDTLNFKHTIFTLFSLERVMIMCLTLRFISLVLIINIVYLPVYRHSIWHPYSGGRAGTHMLTAHCILNYTTFKLILAIAVYQYIFNYESCKIKSNQYLISTNVSY